jgi:flavodoxin
MKSIVLYASRYSNTERIAQTIAEVLREAGEVRLIKAEEAKQGELKSVDLLVVGCPVEKHHGYEEVEAFLKKLPTHELSGVTAATFETKYRGIAQLEHTVSGDMAQELRRAGAKQLRGKEWESFYVTKPDGPLFEGEEERARDWARQLMEQAQRHAA